LDCTVMALQTVCDQVFSPRISVKSRFPAIRGHR
jgi:hypothetical protein